MIRFFEQRSVKCGVHGAIHELVKVILCPSEKPQYQVGSEEFRGSFWRTEVLTPNLIMVILRDII